MADDEPTAAVFVRSYLKKMQFTADLSPAALEQLAVIAAPKTYPLGAVLFREGAAHDSLYLLASGRVGLEMRVPGRGAVRILSLGPGDILGWSPLLSAGPMTATAVALEPCVAVAIPGRDLLSLCQSNHELGCQLMRRMAEALSRRLLATRLQLLDLFSDTCVNDASTTRGQP